MFPPVLLIVIILIDVTPAMLSSTYIVDSLLGEGAYGKVRKCIRREDRKTVAIKMQKINPHNVNRLQSEVTSLTKLSELDPDTCNIVRFYEAFHKSGHLYLVFEHLDKSLYEFINERKSKPLLLKEIRPIVCQLANAFTHLSVRGLIHADVKLDNVMLVDHGKLPYSIKLIDFGLAIDVSDAKAGSTVQNKECRSPEICLGLPFTEAIDMWSLGIMTITLFLGQHFHSSMTEYDTILHIVETLGQPPDSMLHHGLKTRWYFKRDKTSASPWRLKTPEEYNIETGTMSKVTTRGRLRSLDDLLHIYPINHEDYADTAAEMCDMLMFLDMLKKMLQLDPKKRITPCQLLCCPFITGYHLVSLKHVSPYAQSCYDIMRVFQFYLDDDIGDVLHGSWEEPTFGPACSM